jgi:hypothetical protein
LIAVHSNGPLLLCTNPSWPSTCYSFKNYFFAIFADAICAVVSDGASYNGFIFFCDAIITIARGKLRISERVANVKYCPLLRKIKRPVGFSPKAMPFMTAPSLEGWVSQLDPKNQLLRF